MTNEELTEIILGLDAEPRKIVEQYIEYLLFPDGEELEVQQKKQKIYKKYSTDIAGLIAKVEVYAHDLPRPVCGLIETTFRILTSAPEISVKEKELELYDKALAYEEFLISLLNFILIELYVKEIKKYKKVFTNFKFQAFKLEDGTPVMAKIKSELKEIMRLNKRARKKFKQTYEISFFKFMFLLNKFSFLEKFTSSEVSINVHTNFENQELREAFNISEKSIKLCEDYYPCITGNGYDSTLFKRFLHSIPSIVSLVLALIGAFIIFRKVV